MSDKQLPKLSKESKTLYITTKEDAGSAIYFEKVRTVLRNNPCLQIISYDDLMLLKENNSLIIPSNVNIGSVLVHNPYAEKPHTFIIADNADFEIRKQKFCKILEIASYLGASSYEVRAILDRGYKRKLNSDFTVKHSYVELNVNIGVEEKVSQLIGSNYSGRFKGNPNVSLTTYNQALNIAKTIGLYNDPEICLLLTTRHPKHENPQLDYNYSFNLTQEINTYLDAAFSLDATGIFKVNANLKNELETTVNIKIDIKFTFPQNN